MNSKEIFKLSDEDLTKVCGGGKSPGESISEGFFGEMGKFGWAIIALPVGAFLSTVAIWGAKLLTEKFDKKIEESKQPLKPLSMPTPAADSTKA